MWGSTIALTLSILAACGGSGTPSRPEPLAPSGPPRIAAPMVMQDSRYCQRASDGCWDCTDIDFPDELPAEVPGCAGIGMRWGRRLRCASTEHRCCSSDERTRLAHDHCETPPIAASCDPECGDRDGDGHPD